MQVQRKASAPGATDTDKPPIRKSTTSGTERKSVDVSLLVARAIESDDTANVYALIPQLAAIPISTYLAHKTKLKEHFHRRLSLTDLDKAVKEVRSKTRASEQKSTTAIEEDPLFIEDAIYLCEASNCELYYSESTGYLAKRRRGKHRVLLGASVQFERYPSGDDMDTPRAFIEAHFCLPGTEDRVATLRLSRPSAKDLKCWQNLEGKIVELPGDEKDSLLTYKAISAHATKEVLAGRLVNQILKGSFGWHTYNGTKYNVRANGCIDSQGLYYDSQSPLTVTAPKNVLQRLPKREDITLTGIDGQVLIALLHFWQENGPRYFPLAMLFSCARIMLPDIENAGRVDWQLELFGKTSLLKTAIVNYFLALFFGDYLHDSPTEITDSKVGDTGIGSLYKESRLYGVAYQDVDYRYKPGHPLYEKYQDRRLASLGKTRNKAGGGERGKSRGEGSESRPDGGGLTVRTGEVNPHEYSIAQCDDESTDAGACTFLFFGDSNGDKEARLARSIAIEQQRSHLCGIGVLWTQWLARLLPDDTLSLYRQFEQEADARISSIAKEQGYQHIHLRVYNWLKDMLIGARFFLLFLSECTEIEHATALQNAIAQNIDSFVTERLREADALACNYTEHRGGPTQQDSLANKISTVLYIEVKNQHAHWRNKDGKAPLACDMPDGCATLEDAGYKETIADNDSWQPCGPQLGILTSDYVYVNSKDFHQFIEKHIKLKSCPSKLDCLRALEQAGALVTEQTKDKKHYTAQIGHGGPRYVKIRASFIYGDEENASNAPSTEPAPPAPEPEHQDASDPAQSLLDEIAAIGCSLRINEAGAWVVGVPNEWTDEQYTALVDRVLALDEPLRKIVSAPAHQAESTEQDTEPETEIDEDIIDW